MLCCIFLVQCNTTQHKGYQERQTIKIAAAEVSCNGDYVVDNECAHYLGTYALSMAACRMSRMLHLFGPPHNALVATIQIIKWLAKLWPDYKSGKGEPTKHAISCMRNFIMLAAFHPVRAKAVAALAEYKADMVAYDALVAMPDKPAAVQDVARTFH